MIHMGDDVLPEHTAETGLPDPWAAPAAGPLAVDAPAFPRLGGPVVWLQIHPDGSEALRTGRTWSLAPAIGGQRTWWVVPDEGPEPVLAVLRASRRGRVGRTGPDGGWTPRGGRYVDVGTLYAETHPASATGGVTARARLHPAPTRIRVPALLTYIFDTLSGEYARRYPPKPPGVDKR